MRPLRYAINVTLDGRVDHTAVIPEPEMHAHAELVRGDLGEFVRELKTRPGRGIAVGGVTMPLALVELGLIDEYEFIVHPRIVGGGRSLFAGLSKPLDLKPIGRQELQVGRDGCSSVTGPARSCQGR